MKTGRYLITTSCTLEKEHSPHKMSRSRTGLNASQFTPMAAREIRFRSTFARSTSNISPAWSQQSAPHPDSCKERSTCFHHLTAFNSRPVYPSQNLQSGMSPGETSTYRYHETMEISF